MKALPLGAFTPDIDPRGALFSQTFVRFGLLHFEYVGSTPKTLAPIVTYNSESTVLSHNAISLTFVVVYFCVKAFLFVSGLVAVFALQFLLPPI
jgi:hypothetical protein